MGESAQRLKSLKSLIRRICINAEDVVSLYRSLLKAGPIFHKLSSTVTDLRLFIDALNLLEGIFFLYQSNKKFRLPIMASIISKLASIVGG